MHAFYNTAYSIVRARECRFSAHRATPRCDAMRMRQAKAALLESLASALLCSALPLRAVQRDLRRRSLLLISSSGIAFIAFALHCILQSNIVSTVTAFDFVTAIAIAFPFLSTRAARRSAAKQKCV